MFGLKYRSMINSIIKQTSFRFESTYRARNPSESLIIRETLDQNRLLSADEWTEFRQKLLSLKYGSFTKVNIDYTILGHCLPSQLDIGKSYIQYLKQTGIEQTTGALLQLLKLYYKANKELGIQITSNDQQDILDIHEHLRSKFPVIDSATGEGLTYGLILTNDWRKCVELLDSIKKISLPRSFMYGVIISRALQEKDENLAWKILNEMVADRRVIHNEVFTSYTRFCEKNPSTFTTNMNKMLAFIEDNDILVTNEVTNEFQRAYRTFGHTCTTTSITKQGKCKSCHTYLRSVHITDDEFEQLSNHFLDKILIGSNVFNNSTPKEMNSFISFIDATKPFDCVIDGLNVALTIQHQKARGAILANVVKHFVDQKKKVLVIGRKHMENWPKGQMHYVRKNSNLFLTDNLSKDDPFFLYAALRSGPKTDFVTRDLIRNHTHLLDNNLKIIFRRWQQQHQFMVQHIDNNGRISFVDQIEFDMTAQEVDGCWHIPYENERLCVIPEQSLDLRKNWLCISRSVNINKAF